MPDAFETLHAPIAPVDPDPVFATNLRARLARLLTPGGLSVSDLDIDLESPASTGAATAVADPGVSRVTYTSLWVPDVERAATFFGSVLGWAFGPGSGAQGRQVEGATPRQGMWGGHERSTLFVCYGVADLVGARERVLAAGGSAEPPVDEPYGRIVDCVDTEGARFALVEQPAGTAAKQGERQGDLAYITLEVGDSARVRDFYGSVLGWRIVPGHVEDGWQVENSEPLVGIAGGRSATVAVPMYRVDDIAAAVARVRVGGGTASDPERQPYGISSDCIDDQGTRFYLGQL